MGAGVGWLATLADGWADWRNRRLSDPAFQRAAMRWPIGRSIGRAQAGGLFDLIAGFVYAQVVAAFVELGVLERLAAGPVEADGLGLDADAGERLLRAGAALALARPLAAGGGYGLGARGAALLGNAGALAMVRHHALLYRDLADPVALLRRGPGGGALAGYWPYAGGAKPGAAAGPYSGLMAASQALVADAFLGAVPMRGVRTLLDVGGGNGAFLRAVVARHPGVRPVLFDLPEVAAVARAAFSGAGVAAEVHGGSMFEDEWPGGADVLTFVRVLHDHDDAPVAALLARARRALAPGGRLVVCEPMAGTRGARAMGDAYFGLYLWAMGSGRPRTARELTAMLRAAGFGQVNERRTALPVIARVLMAQA